MGKIEEETDLSEEDLQWAFDKCLELLEEWYPDYEEADIIGQVLAVYDNCFE